MQIGDLVLAAKSQRNGSTYIPPTKLTPKYIGPFQVVATDPSRMQATCTAFTTIPGRVNDLTTHVRFIKRLSSNFKGDLALFRRSADIDFPDDEIEALCQLMFDEHDQIFIEVKYYLCPESANQWHLIDDLYPQAPDLVKEFCDQYDDPRITAALDKLSS